MKLTYRPEIDGLRAIAVGAVILYHAQITIFGHQPFKGGFIGVDIFFVISGYLITSIILKELVTTGSFSFKHFYERRIRRILPALLFVMLVSLPFAWMYLLPSSFVDFSKSILYSLGFGSNFYFHYSGQEYGAESGLSKPFLHTWSLSVEEQYYILFPIILLVTFKYFKKYFFLSLSLGFILSLLFSYWCSRNYNTFNFYSFPSRSWELLAGSILAYLEIIKGYKNKNKILNIIVPNIGLILIIYSVLFINFTNNNSPFHLLPSILGTCFIIWFQNKNSFLNKLLSSKILVAIGLCSYSLYLWHYPIFSFVRILQIDIGSMMINFFILIFLFGISIFSYFFIEKPFRKKNNFKFIVFLFLFLFAINFVIVFKNGYQAKYPKFNNLKLSDNKVKCIRENFEKKEVILIGNSHAATLSYDLKKKLENKGISFECFNTNYYPNFIVVNKYNKKKIADNRKDNEQIRKILSENNNLVIIIFTRNITHIYDGENFYNPEIGFKTNVNEIHNMWVPSDNINLNKPNRKTYLLDNIFSELKYIKNLGHKLILVYPYPETGFDVPNKLYRFKNDNKFPLISINYNDYKKRTKVIFDLYDKLIGENIYRVYPHKFLCNNFLKNRCVVNTNEDIYYYDGDHPSLKGAEMINNLIMKEIEKIELKSN